MKIFISHSSTNKDYGNALVQLLRGLDVPHESIIFTSNVAYGIPNGKNIFNWLKNTISEKPYVIYLLSNEYYLSVACLNEMGAAWIVENEHSVIFTPKFEITSPQFQNGALDPREIGFYIDDEDRVLVFIEQIKQSFKITTSSVVINQKVKAFLTTVKEIKNKNVFDIEENPISNKKNLTMPNPMIDLVSVKEVSTESKGSNNLPISTEKRTFSLKMNSIEQLLADIIESKLKDVELLLICYAIDTSRVKLMTGWLEGDEIANIREWEDINGLKNLLSNQYGSVIRRFELRKYTEVSQITGSGIPKEVKFKSEIEERIIDLPESILQIIEDAVSRNTIEELPF